MNRRLLVFRKLACAFLHNSQNLYYKFIKQIYSLSISHFSASGTGYARNKRVRLLAPR